MSDCQCSSPLAIWTSLKLMVALVVGVNVLTCAVNIYNNRDRTTSVAPIDTRVEAEK